MEAYSIFTDSMRCLVCDIDSENDDPKWADREWGVHFQVVVRIWAYSVVVIFSIIGCHCGGYG